MNVGEVMSSKPVTVKPETTISEVYGKFQKFNIHEVIVKDDSDVKGMISHKELIIRNVPDPARTKVGRVMVKTPVVKPGDDVEYASQLMLNNGVRALPVMEKKKLVGLLSQTDVVDKVCEFKTELKAKDLMVPISECLTENDDLGMVRALMREYDIHRLPVVDERKRLVGVISTLGILRQLKKTRGAERVGELKGTTVSLDSLPLGSFIANPFSVNEDAPVTEVVDIMKKRGVSVIVVCDANMIPVGAISQADVIAGFIKTEVGKKILVEVLGAEELEDESLDFIYRQIQTKAKALNNFFPLDGLKIRLRKTKGKEYGNIFYEVDAHAYKGKKTLTTKRKSWNIYIATRDVLKELIRKTRKEKEKIEDREKKHSRM